MTTRKRREKKRRWVLGEGYPVFEIGSKDRVGLRKANWKIQDFGCDLSEAICNTNKKVRLILEEV